MVQLEAGPFLLPQEILEEIFQHLGVDAILSLRVTCKTFYSATVSVWRYLAREIQFKPQNPRPEEPLEDYTPEELRGWVLRRHGAEKFWDAPSFGGTRMRETKHVVRHPIVLPGGRWFLFMSSQDEIMVVDMDSPKLEAKLLVKVDRYIEGTEIEDRPGRFLVWVDPSAARLSFKIALINPDLRRPSNTEGRSRVHIFHACLVGHGEGATLTAKPFRRFEGFFPGGAELEAMNDRYFVQVKVPEVGSGRYDLYVFDCEKDYFTRVRLCDFECPLLVDIFIPSEDKVAIVDTQSVHVYAIPAPSTTLGSEWHPVHIISAGWPPPFASRSNPYTGKTATTVMCLQGGDLVGLGVPLDITGEHSVTRIAPFPKDRAKWRTIDLFDTLDYVVDPERCFLRLLRYPWDPHSPEGPSGASILSHEVDIPPHVFPPSHLFFGAHSFHSSIGRLVMVSRVEELIRIYDLVPVRGSDFTTDVNKMK